MRLLEPYSFVDHDQKTWAVPQGAEVDGASIPQPLWSLIGGPFEGKYRNASVIHDFYCDLRSEPWRAVHRVFYSGMRASGVSESRAKLMYAAVYFGGPRWSDTTVRNVNLRRHDITFRIKHTPFQEAVLDTIAVNGESAGAFLRRKNLSWPNGDETVLDMDQLAKLIEAAEPELSEIDGAIDAAVGVLEAITPMPNKHTFLATAIKPD